jgi:hypothetical protein
MSPLTIEASLLRALHAFGSAWLDANNRRFSAIDLKLRIKSVVQFDCCPLNNFFWLTKAYVELAIIIVLAYGGGPARPWDLAGCLDMIARAAARLMRLKDYGVAGGGPADLVCLDANSPADAVATLAQPLWGIKRGRLSFTRSRPQLHPPDSD